jgi:hypothetical protein
VGYLSVCAYFFASSVLSCTFSQIWTFVNLAVIFFYLEQPLSWSGGGGGENDWCNGNSGLGEGDVAGT